jgi:hypothetical protein
MRIILFALCILCNAAYGQNKKPVAVNDTFPRYVPIKLIPSVENGDTVWSQSIPAYDNVLENDRDPNGDRMNITSFNGHPFKNVDSVVFKDTAVFYLHTNGNISVRPLNWEIRWEKRLYYNVNDGKVGAPSKAMILYRFF